MFCIDYTITKTGFEKVGSFSEEEIHYDLLLGSIRFEDAGKIIEMDWEWIPLLDFAYCLKEITKVLSSKAQASETFEFTDSEATLVFSRINDYIEIKPSFTSETMKVNFEDFEGVVKSFYAQMLQELQKGASQKLINSAFKKFFE